MVTKHTWDYEILLILFQPSTPSLCPPTSQKVMILPVLEDGKLDFQMHFLTRPRPTSPIQEKRNSSELGLFDSTQKFPLGQT